jgi:hypothetical protein
VLEFWAVGSITLTAPEGSGARRGSGTVALVCSAVEPA